MIIHCQNWLFSIQKLAYLLSISINNDIFQIMRSLNINKAYDHNNISIRMIKICDKAVVKPLCIIHKNCTDTGIFPDLWKKCNIVSGHKKGDKQLLQNYRTVFFVTYFWKNS